MRMWPLDEVSRRRLGIKDYVLVLDESWSSYRSIFEVYHDENKLFNMEKCTINIATGEEQNDFSVYLTLEDAEKVLESLQGFVNKYSDED